MHSLSDALVYGVVGCVILALANLAINRGGAGKLQQGAVLYKMRPGMSVMLLIVAALGLFFWGCSLFAILGARWDEAAFEFAVGIPFLLLSAFAGFQRVVLNSEGIHHERRFLKPIRISWADLDHFEIAANGMMSVLVLRPGGEGRAIALSSYGFDVRDLLRRIAQTKPIKQLPVRRQRWYRY